MDFYHLPAAKTITATSVALLSLQISFPGYAENAEPELKNAPTGNLEEITVTARKRSESLQEIPLSVSAFSAEQLKSAGATNNYDVALLTPNFSTNQQLGRRLDRPVIRGQSGAAVGGEPNASYFIDGVFVSGSISSATLGPVERVEILRGPQSATFGRATFAGAVNYVTRQPSDELEGELRAIGGSHNTVQLNGWVSGPVTDSLKYFLAAGTDNYGGEWRNSLGPDQARTGGYANPPQQGDSSDLGGTRTNDIVGKILWSATDTTDITLKVGYTDAKDDHYMQYIVEPGELNCYLPTDGTNGTVYNRGELWYNTSQGAFCGQIDESKVTYSAANPFAGPYVPGAPDDGAPRQARFNIPDFKNGVAWGPGDPNGLNDPTFQASPARPGAEREQFRTLIQLDQDLGSWDMTARFAYNKDDFLTAYDLDQREDRYNGLAAVFHMVEQRDIEDSSLELIVSSPAENRLRGSIGTYFFSSERNQSARRFTGYQCAGLGCGLAEFELPATTKIDNSSIFGSLDYDIMDNLTLSMEARYAKDEKKIDSPYTCDDPGGEFDGERLNDRAESKALTPRITLSWQANDDVMVYALVSKGNKPAEFNDGFFRVTENACDSLVAREEGLTQTAEETAWTYEAGTKTTWFGGRALLNLSVFAIEWTNQTVFETAELPSGVIINYLSNAGRSEVFGVEIESSFAFTDNLTGSLSYGLADGQYKRYTSELLANTTGVGLDPTTLEVDPDSNNAKGNALPFSPRHSVIGSLSYARDLNARIGWFARTDAVWESKRYTGAANLLTLSDKTIWNGRIGLESDNWTVSTYVNNILDDTTPQSAPSFVYINHPTINWGKIEADCGVGLPCRNNVETAALAPSRGTQWGIDLNYRF